MSDSVAMEAAERGSGSAAYTRLREAIVRLELPPATPVSEAQLVDAYGFSKAAIRAALARLKAEGLVLAEPRRGHMIAPLTMRDVLEIYDLRLMIEPPATAAAVGRLDRDELHRLHALAEPEFDVEDLASVEAFMRANREIHLALVEASGNRRAAQIVERLLDDTERARLIALRTGAASGGVRARAELQAVLTALEDGDGRRAGELMATSIREFRDELVDRLHAAALDMPLGATNG